MQQILLKMTSQDKKVFLLPAYFLFLFEPNASHHQQQKASAAPLFAV